jgi:exopolysaccharide biosynthesis WecB/TagA/CpsF family protein
MTMILRLDNLDPDEFAGIAENFGSDRFGYVVTPNIDHVIRLHDDAEFRALYADAAYVLLDSRLLAYILRLIYGMHPEVCTGSDLTARLFTEIIRPDDAIVLIGSSERQAAQLRERFGLKQLRHYNPPMGFIKDPTAVEECLRFVEANNPFRFCLIAVGTPQGEALARQLKARGRAKGLTFCIGASINFLTGTERRAPYWMRSCGLEWLFRLALSPRRLAGRYLLRGPRIFGLLSDTEFVLSGTGTVPTEPNRI